VIAAAMLSALGLIHLYWAAGGTFGKGATVPIRHGKAVLHPTPVMTVVVAIGLFAMAALVAARIGWATWVVAGIFLLRAVGDFRYVGFFKRVRDSRFAKFDTLFYSPLCLLLTALILFC
jgi:hypothetical protein